MFTATFKAVSSTAQFISEAAMRVFTPNDNTYPVIGIQPFTGDVFKFKRRKIVSQ
jgi:hypothetical protein